MFQAITDFFGKVDVYPTLKIFSFEISIYIPSYLNVYALTLKIFQIFKKRQKTFISFLPLTFYLIVPTFLSSSSTLKVFPFPSTNVEKVVLPCSSVNTTPTDLSLKFLAKPLKPGLCS